MPHYSVKPIRLVLQRSYLLAALLMLASVSACLAVLCMPVHPGLRLAVGVLIMAAGTFYIVLHAWLGLPWSYRMLELDAKGELRLTRKDGASVVATVLPDSFVGAYFLILNVKVSGSRWRRSLIVTSDRAAAQPFRQLRVWLRWGRHDWRLQDLPGEDAT
ncbi:MAG TPA: protein YgfX [Methylophilaceae bacterium]|nr:protein YgfX [Methylophilaceae bacterium]